jgi:hypothetical protein
MKKILEDLKAEGLSKKEMFIYGFLYPLGLMIILIAASAIE